MRTDTGDGESHGRKVLKGKIDTRKQDEHEVTKAHEQSGEKGGEEM